MRASEPGELALQLPWLPPGPASLVALARTDSPAVWPAIRHDPGAVILLARHLHSDGNVSLSSAVFSAANVLESALRCWRELPTSVSWSRPDIYPIHQAALACAGLAERLARRAGGCDPACAWVGGLLAPLGWLAVCAVDPAAAGECLRRPVYAERLPEVQREIWTLDAEAIARRLARRWQLPNWLRAIVGHLALPAEVAQGVGADERLFPLVQLAVMLAATNGHDLGLPVGTEYPKLLSLLNLSEDDLRRIGGDWREAAQESTELSPPPPHPDLIPDLLELAIQKRKLADGPFGEQLEEEVDQLQEALAKRQAAEAARLQRHKLRSLAEFAAGAGHEINNPLAVISGQSQYLLNREEDAAKQGALRAIIRQTERIHQILTELMQFARPPQPRRQELDLRAVVREVVAKHAPAEGDDGPRLEWDEPAEAMPVHADPAMIRTALGCLVRNAVESAPKDGWARVSLEGDGEQWLIVVEDSGPGPAAGRREHMFDPFYSGRQAGRGRGLGLPTAWRLAQENGGDVRYEPRPESPARFVLSLPVCPCGTNPLDSAVESLRKSA